jgi:hypothetical protein
MHALYIDQINPLYCSLSSPSPTIFQQLLVNRFVPPLYIDTMYFSIVPTSYHSFSLSPIIPSDSPLIAVMLVCVVCVCFRSRFCI